MAPEHAWQRRRVRLWRSAGLNVPRLKRCGASAVGQLVPSELDLAAAQDRARARYTGSSMSSAK